MTRLSTGNDSKQDYRTPANLMEAVYKRFGTIVFDLAAVAENAQHERYFAPDKLIEISGKGKDKKVIEHPHFDPQAYGHDAFKHSWADLSRKLRAPVPDSYAGLLWLNCEFSDIATWSKRCKQEGRQGANILLLTPAAVGSNWFRDNIAGEAAVYILNGRPSFIEGGPGYNKDCMISWFGPYSARGMHLWQWKTNTLLTSWLRSA
jgi:hypothetical protein